MSSVEHDSPTAAVLIIGNEILSGRTQEANLGVIARKLFGLGIKLEEARVVADREADIVAAVRALRERYTYVITTGGIGPTHDDITSASLAVAFGVRQIEHPEARARLEAYYKPTDLNAARLRMALVPEGSTLIDNPLSCAPGFRIGNVFVLAGVPAIMAAMLDQVTSELRHGQKFYVSNIACTVPESLLADALAVLAQKYADLDIGSYPIYRPGNSGLVLVVRGTDRSRVQMAAEDIATLIRAQGEEPKLEISG